MSFLSQLKKISKKAQILAAVSIIFLGAASFVFAQGQPTTQTPLTTGTVYGFGWMGADIINPGLSDGGGGWLKFNCAPEACGHGIVWGVKADVLDPASPSYGAFRGQAWSNNYGWLDFSEDIVSSCWTNNPAETANETARITFPTGKVVGWAKFVAGDDVTDDGWDGCVSFSGSNYSTFVNLSTGALTGWAWGSDVVGWVSFQNPECPFCNTTVVLDRILGCMDPNATNYNPLATVDDGSCIYGPVRGCTDSTATNYNPLATVDDGSCIYGPVLGCTNPTATNYNPLATVDDGSCTYGPGPGRPVLNLQVTPDVFVLGSGNYSVGPISWTATNLSQIEPNSCSANVAKISGPNSTVFTLSGWTGSQPNPNHTISATPGFNLASQMVGATTATSFRFTIRCQLVDGGTISDDDTILVIEPTNPPVEPPLLWLHITDPNNDPSGSLLSEVIPPWNSSIGSGGDDVTLQWYALNVVPGSCVADSMMYQPNSTTEIGENASWEGSRADGVVSNQVLNVTNQSVIHNTKFQISCERLDQPGVNISAQVCMGVDGVQFPSTACSAGNSINRPPGYKEI